jgi:dUTP pyrophosphatase
MLQALRDFADIACYLGRDQIEYSGTNALDFLGRLYDRATFFLRRKRDLYVQWSVWVPSLGGKNHGRLPLLRWVRTDRRAKPPSKERASDSGYDLTLIREVRRHGPLIFYGTGIKIEPDHGFYFDLVARSSIVKTGHILANAIGVIDRGYRGEILVPMYKLVDDAPDLPLPCRIVQLVPRPIVHFDIEEVDSLDDTDRKDGGFGSTGL